MSSGGDFENLYKTFNETPTLSGLKRLTAVYKKTPPENQRAFDKEKNEKMVRLVSIEEEIDADTNVTQFFTVIEILLNNIRIIGNAAFKLYKKATASVRAISKIDFRNEFLAHKEALLLLERIKEQIEAINELYSDEIDFANKCFSFFSMKKTQKEIDDFFDSGIINEHGRLLERYDYCVSIFENGKLGKKIKNNERKIATLLFGGKRKNNNKNKSKKTYNKNKSKKTYNKKNKNTSRRR
jgi:hypothetical protein